MQRSDGRRPDELRPLALKRRYTKFAEGSVLIELGDTRVVCTASLEERVPPWLRGSKQGWLTAEYGMLPRATQERSPRDTASGRTGGRSLGGTLLRPVNRPSQLWVRRSEAPCGIVTAKRFVSELSSGHARVELGEGVLGTCPMPSKGSSEKALERATQAESKADLSSLSSMLTARWKGAATGGASRRESAETGQIRSFRIAKLDPAAKKIELELAE